MMLEHVKELVSGYVSSAVIITKTIEDQLSDFASECSDDEEVQAFFSDPGTAGGDRERLEELLNAMRIDSGFGADRRHDATSLESLTPPIVESAHRPEERLLHNLIVSYSLEAGAYAFSEVVGALAAAVNDEATGSIAAQMREERRAAMAAIFHFLPSRSKIAFNMLTVDEVDPAIETKVADDRVIGS